MPTFEQLTVEHVVRGVDRSNQDRRTRAVVDIATITLLVDAGLTTFEKAAQRIVEIQACLSEPYQAPAVSQQLQAITRWLHAQQFAQHLEDALDPAPGDDIPKW